MSQPDETHIECTLRVRGSELAVDYAGTSKQIDRGLNSVMNYTYAYTVYPIKCALDPETPGIALDLGQPRR